MQRGIVGVASLLAALVVWGGAPETAQADPASEPAAAQTHMAQLQTDECDPFLSGIASFVIPGWGQWLNGERQKAVTHISLGLGLSAASVLLFPTPIGYLAGVGRTLWGFFSTYDAFTTCVRRYSEASRVLSSDGRPTLGLP